MAEFNRKEYDEEQVREMLQRLDSSGIGPEMRKALQLTEDKTKLLVEDLENTVHEEFPFNIPSQKMTMSVAMAQIGANLLINSMMTPVMIEDFIKIIRKNHAEVYKLQKENE